MSLISIMAKEQTKKMSKWWILVFAVLIFVGVNVYNHYQENKAYQEKKQEAINTCNNQIKDPALLQECIDKVTKSVEFSRAYNEANKPLYPISDLLTALILGIILFYLIRFLSNIYGK